MSLARDQTIGSASESAENKLRSEEESCIIWNGDGNGNDGNWNCVSELRVPLDDEISIVELKFIEFQTF